MGLDSFQIHDELMTAFREYYKAQLTWREKGTKRSCIAMRKWMLVIEKLCVENRGAIATWRRTDYQKRKLESHAKGNPDFAQQKAAAQKSMAARKARAEAAKKALEELENHNQPVKDNNETN